MSARHDNDAVGYGRPPLATRWKKGQSGNPRGRRKNASLGVVETIDRMFAEEIDIVESGVKRRVTVFEAILLRVWAKEMAGSKRAAAVRMQCQELVPKPTGPPEIIIREVEDDQ